MIAINDYWLYNINKRNDLFFFQNSNQTHYNLN